MMRLMERYSRTSPIRTGWRLQCKIYQTIRVLQTFVSIWGKMIHTSKANHPSNLKMETDRLCQDSLQVQLRELLLPNTKAQAQAFHHPDLFPTAHLDKSREQAHQRRCCPLLLADPRFSEHSVRVVRCQIQNQSLDQSPNQKTESASSISQICLKVRLCPSGFPWAWEYQKSLCKVGWLRQPS